MRISDWSSDVCSSDLPAVLARVATKAELFELANEEKEHCGGYYDAPRLLGRPYDWREVAKNAKGAAAWGLLSAAVDPARMQAEELRSSEERRVGKEWVSPCRSRWSPAH